MKQFILSIFCSFAIFSCCSKIDAPVVNSKPSASDYSFSISQPLNFDSIEALHQYVSSCSPIMRSTDGFVSYAETVMQQPGYDDMPEAIMSYKFGSVLNSEGELVVAGYFIKLCSHGLLIGRVQNAEIIRSLSTKQDVLSYCSSKTLIPDLNPSDEVYELYGYDQVYLFDLFHKKDEERKSDDGMIPETKSIAAGLVEYQTTRSSLGLVLNPYGDFTIPPAGQQKVLFDDSHCNDTKIWAKNYLVIYDSGIKIKTMQKGFLGTWSKFQNPIEGGVTSWVVEETG